MVTMNSTDPIQFNSSIISLLNICYPKAVFIFMKYWLQPLFPDSIWGILCLGSIKCMLQHNYTSEDMKMHATGL